MSAVTTADVVAIGGEPATGKTTLILAVLLRLGGPGAADVKLGCARGHVLLDGRLLVLGNYRLGGPFGGTDRLSMAVQPDALDLITCHVSRGRGHRVLFEGDRLYNRKLFFALRARGHTLALFRAVATEAQLSARQRARGNKQSQTFLRSRRTKQDNIQAHESVRCVDLNAAQDTALFAEQLATWARSP